MADLINLDDYRNRCGSLTVRQACLPAGVDPIDQAALDALVRRRRRLQPGERLFRTGDAMSVILGRRYREEMLDISVVWERYIRRWGTPTAIAAAQWEFEADTSSLGRLLDQRMLREERELYPAAQRL